MMDVRKKIKLLYENKGYNNTTFARAIGLSKTSVSNWFNEINSMPSVRTLENICYLFGITMSELFYDGDLDKLDGQEMTVLYLFNKLSPEQKPAFIEILRTYVGDK